MDVPIESRIRALTAGLLTDDRVAALYLFGSHAQGAAGPSSDIDVGVLLAARVGREEYFTLRLQYLGRCMDLLGTDKVDLVILNDAPPILAYEVVSRGRLLCQNNREERVTFEADRVGKYLDFKPFLEVQVRTTKAHLLKGSFFD